MATEMDGARGLLVWLIPRSQSARDLNPIDDDLSLHPSDEDLSPGTPQLLKAGSIVHEGECGEGNRLNSSARGFGCVS